MINQKTKEGLDLKFQQETFAMCILNQQKIAVDANLTSIEKVTLLKHNREVIVFLEKVLGSDKPYNIRWGRKPVMHYPDRSEPTPEFGLMYNVHEHK